MTTGILTCMRRGPHLSRNTPLKLRYGACRTSDWQKAIQGFWPPNEDHRRHGPRPSAPQRHTQASPRLPDLSATFGPHPPCAAHGRKDMLFAAGRQPWSTQTLARASHERSCSSGILSTLPPRLVLALPCQQLVCASDCRLILASAPDQGGPRVAALMYLDLSLLFLSLSLCLSLTHVAQSTSMIRKASPSACSFSTQRDETETWDDVAT
jgi:hypothetical protein